MGELGGESFFLINGCKGLCIGRNELSYKQENLIITGLFAVCFS